MELLAQNGKVIVTRKMNHPDARRTPHDLDDIPDFKGLSDLTIHGKLGTDGPLHHGDLDG